MNPINKILIYIEIKLILDLYKVSIYFFDLIRYNEL